MTLLASYVLSGCPSTAPPPIPFEIEEETEYLCLGADRSGSFCDANVALLAAQVDFIAEFLRIPPPERCIPAFWTENTGDCGVYNGCYQDGVIYSTWMSMPHEIVHAVVDRAGLGGAPPFMEEGLAEALSGTALRSNGLGMESILKLGEHREQGAGLSSEDYESSGHLIAWMLGRYGVDLVVQLYSRLESTVDKDEIVSVVEELVGVHFPAIAEEYAGARGTVYAGKGPFSCGAAASELSWVGRRAVGEVAFSWSSGEDFRRLDLGEVLGHSEELWRGYRVELSEGEVRCRIAEAELRD